jgi:hypothetical protein
VDGRIEDHIKGWYQALVESRVPFELVHDRLLDRSDIGQFTTLILPQAVALSDAQCRQVEAFVRRGGSLVATHESSLCDERGDRRPNFGLADLLGVDYAGRVEARMQNAYLRLEHDTTPRHPLLNGLADAPRIIHGVSRVEVRPRRPFGPMPLTLIPSYPDLPMEQVYPRVERTDIAQVFLHEEPGGGRVAYFPWDIDRTFWEVLSGDHLALLRNAVHWATRGDSPVVVTGPGVLDVTVWEQRASMTVHLVNLTNPMMMKGPVRELLPVGEQVVRLRLPEGRRPRAVRLLAAGRTLKPVVDEGRLVVTVPSVLDHEVVAVDF